MDTITTIRIPRWLFQLIGINYCIWIAFYAALIGIRSDVLAGLGFFLIGAALIIPILFITYLFWRFYWWMLAFSLTACTMLTFGTLMIAPSAINRLNTATGATVAIPQMPIGTLLTVTLSPLLLWAFWNLRPRRRATAPSDNESLFNFTAPKAAPQPPRTIRRNDDLTPMEFQNEIARLLLETNPDLDVSVRENQIDIDVFKNGKQVGIVRCKLAKSGSPIAPLFVQEVHRLKERLGLSTAYIATTAQFNNDARELAEQLEIRIIDGDKIKQYQQRSARR